MTERPRSSRWSVISAFAMMTAATQLLWVTFTPITTQTAQVYHVSEGSVGWLSEVFPLIYVVLALPCGLLTDRWFRPSLMLGAILTLAGGLVRISPGYTVVLLGQILISIGQPLVVNAMNKIASLYVAPDKRPVAIGIGSASMFLGILMAMLAGPFLIPIGMGTLLWSQGILTLVAVLWLAWALRFSPLYTAPPDLQVSVRRVWADPSIRILSVLLFVGFGLFIAVTTWLQVLLAKHGVSDVEVGIALALMTASGIVGAGLVPDWSMKRGVSRTVVVCSLVCCTLMLILVMVGHPFWLIAILLVLTGFLLLADLPIVLSTVESHSPATEVGTATGVLLLFGNAGGIVLALLVQLLIGRPVVALSVLVVVCLATIPVVRRFPLVRTKASAAMDGDGAFRSL